MRIKKLQNRRNESPNGKVAFIDYLAPSGAFLRLEGSFQ